MKKDDITIILIIVIIYAVGMLFGITCPILYFTGISCPGCGMTRAWINIFDGNLQKAFIFHPLFWMPLLVGLLWLIKNKIDKEYMKNIYRVLLSLILIVWFLRFFIENDPASQFNPKEGMIINIIESIINIK